MQNVSVAREKLLVALQTCQPAVAKSGNRAIELTHFWFDGQYVSGYNGRVGIFAPVSLPDLKGGVQDTLLSWLEKTVGETVDITIEKDRLTVSVAHAKAHFPMLETERQIIRLQEVVELLPARSVTLNRSMVKDLSYLLVSLDARSAVPARMGAFFVPNGDSLDVYATDDNTISWLSTKLPDGFEVESFIVVPTGFLEQLIKMLPADTDEGRKDEALDLFLNENLAMAMNSATEVVVMGNLVDCPNMPDFVSELRSYYTSNSGEHGVPVPEELSSAMERILLIQNSAVAFSVKDDILHIHSDRDASKLDERLPLSDHPDIETYYNPELVFRALKDRESVLIDRGAMSMKGPENFLHLIAASRPNARQD